MRLAGRVAVVTGGGSGIGRAIARRFAAEGATVAIVDRDTVGAADTVGLIEGSGGRSTPFEADVSRGDEVDRAISQIVTAFGRIGVLVNNAAVGGGDDPLATDEATWDRLLAIVLKSVFLCSRATLPHMLRQGSGVIVNVASVNGLTDLGEEAYSAAKAGVINFTQNLAIRYGERGIRANVICPGTIQTPIWRQRAERDPDVFDRLARWYPLGRVGQPEEVAAAALYLASDESSFVTGAVLPVDGGLTAGMARMGRELSGGGETVETP